MANPWLSIPAEDYEAHMASPEVAQAQALDGLLGSALVRYAPASLALLGCSTGNGLNHVDPRVTRRVAAVDINGAFVEILKARHGRRLPGLDPVVADFADPAFRIEPVALVFAGLVFEYVHVGRALARVESILVPGGVLVAVLQRPSPDSPSVTPTPYRSLERLAPIMNLVDPGTFSASCTALGLAETERRDVPLRKGKAFFVGHYWKSP